MPECPTCRCKTGPCPVCAQNGCPTCAAAFDDPRLHGPAGEDYNADAAFEAAVLASEGKEQTDAA
jgi:hypothetical protein